MHALRYIGAVRIALFVCIVLCVSLVAACAKKPPAAPAPPQIPVEPYTGDNDESYVPMNYYY